MNLGHCPICYDGYEICKCTEKDYKKYYANLEKEKMKDHTTFTIKCTMKNRWIPHFLGMLKSMENLGRLGGSRWVRFYSDGDGDYRPKFEWDKELPEPKKPLKIEDVGQSPRSEGYDFDAG